MKRIASAILIAISVATLAACASPSKQYVMSTKDGRMEITTTRPEAIPGTDLYVYYNQTGNLKTMKQSDFAMIIDR